MENKYAVEKNNIIPVGLMSLSSHPACGAFKSYQVLSPKKFKIYLSPQKHRQMDTIARISLQN